MKVLTKTPVKPVAYSAVESSVSTPAKPMDYGVLFAIILFDHDINNGWCLMQ